MEKNTTVQPFDPALLPFLNSADARETENVLADLLAEEIEPAIKKTLRNKLHISLKLTDFSRENQDALELFSEVKLLLISELTKLKSNNNGKIIENLNSYTASVTINAYRQYLRAKYPLRRQLKNKLRYLLTHHPKFSLWENENGVWFCGFKDFSAHGEKAKPPDAEAVCAALAETANKISLNDKNRTIDLVKLVFEYVKTPLPFGDLISIVAELQGIKDQKEQTETEFDQTEFAMFDDKTLPGIEQREILKKIWDEICLLPLRHRLALLLNLKDRSGDCVIHFFPLLRIVSIKQIAETLEFAPEQFARIWNELPWEDLRIAGHLGLTRQQVINLRQSARARLARSFAPRD